MIDLKIKKQIGDLSLDAELNCEKSMAVSLIGESGAGKTTLLRLIAGLEKPDSGYIKNNGKTLFSKDEKMNVPTHKRKISYVFQEYTLFPHWTIEKNILYTAANKEFANELIEHFKISHLRKRKPESASGGERQRTAFAQAIAREPELLLLDEPFSSLDTKNRKIASDFLYSVRDKISCPIILVTHDEAEAFYLGDFLYEMVNGKINRFKGMNSELPYFSSISGNKNYGDSDVCLRRVAH